jgi:hypothetical protein
MVCGGQLSVAMTKGPRKSTYKEERFFFFFWLAFSEVSVHGCLSLLHHGRSVWQRSICLPAAGNEGEAGVPIYFARVHPQGHNFFH